MKRILTLAASILTTNSFAAELQLPVARMTSDCHRYSSIMDAVTQALTCATRQAAGMEYEYGGVIYEPQEGAYCFTHPVTSFDRNSIAYRAERRYRIVAMYHTHTAGSFSELFSPTDVRAVVDIRVPSFIGALDRGTIHRLDFSEVRDVFAKRSPPAKRSGTLAGGLAEPPDAARQDSLVNARMAPPPKAPGP